MMFSKNGSAETYRCRCLMYSFSKQGPQLVVECFQNSCDQESSNTLSYRRCYVNLLGYWSCGPIVDDRRVIHFST